MSEREQSRSRSIALGLASILLAVVVLAVVGAVIAVFALSLTRQQRLTINSKRPPVASFAQSFTTKELTFERATGEDLTLTHQLCINASDRTPVCVTGDQLRALLSQSSAGATPESVPSSPSNIREPEPPIFVSSSTPDRTNSEQPDNANWTLPDNATSTLDILKSWEFI